MTPLEQPTVPRNPLQKEKHRQKGSENTKSADKEGDIDSGNYHIKLVSVTKSSNDYEGKPTAILTYELTNKKNENSNFMDVDIQAFQNGHELDTAIYMDQPEGYDAESPLKPFNQVPVRR